MGSKGKYAEWIEQDGLLQIEGWAREGLTDKQISTQKIGINEATFCRWKERFPQLTQALKRGKAPVDFKVENALLKSALGHKETVRKAIKVKTEKQKVGEGKIVEEHIEYVDEEVYIPPQVVAQIFWLKNRRPDKWKDKVEQTVITEVEDLTPLVEMLNGTENEEDTVATAVPEA